MLALVFAASAMVEGGVATWGVLYLRAARRARCVAGVGAYVVGNLLATLTRVGSITIVNTLGQRRTVALDAAITGAEMASEVLCHMPLLAATGLAAASLGISVVWPLLIADVGDEARDPALAIGGVTAAGYLGMVAGPPIVGRSARRTPDGADGARRGRAVRRDHPRPRAHDRAPVGVSGFKCG